jgi:hypothetical protein
MKIALIGNSHLAALKLGWPSPSPHEATFFSSPSGSLRSLKVQDDFIFSDDEKTAKFLALSSNGVKHIAPREYDYIFLVGNGTGAQRFVALQRKCRTFDNKKSALPLVSRAVWNEASKSATSHGYVQRIITMIRSVSNVPILVIPDPMPSERITSCPNEGYIWAGELGVEAAAKARMQINGLVCDGIDALSQPEVTLAAPHLTKSSFSDESRKLESDRFHPEDEYFHMNHLYGQIVANEALRFVHSKS